MEADGIALPFQHGALEIVVEQDTRASIEGLERRDMAAQEVLHARIEEEAQEYLARPTQHHDEGHQWPVARRTFHAPGGGCLIAPAGFLLRALTRFLCTGAGTVNLATVAAAADEYLSPAARAQEEPCRCRVRLG